MTNIQDRYASAINSSNLKSDERTVQADPDVLGAMGLADRILSTGSHADGRPHPKVPLAVPLARLLEGDRHAVSEVVATLAAMVYRQSFTLRVKIAHLDAVAIAQACVAWLAAGTCRACGGHGKTPIPGAPMLSERDCHQCEGTGRILLEKEFPVEQRELARWATAEIDRTAARAFDLAARKLAPRLDL